MYRALILLSFLWVVFGHVGFSDPVVSWASTFDPSEYQRGEILSSEYLLFWSVDDAKKNINLAAVVHTEGWVGFGLSANGGMKGADIAVLRKSQNGAFFIEDRFAHDYVEPTIDTVQSWKLNTLKTEQKNGFTAFAFSRAIQSCDLTQDFDFQNYSMDCIFSYGVDQNFGYHGEHRGSKLLEFLTPRTAISLPTDSSVVNVTTPRFSIPTTMTNYICSSHVLPGDRKYHVIEIRPIVKSPMVHHMILYTCESDINKPDPATCGAMKTECRSFWIGWAVGGKDIQMPLEAGFPMGSGQSSTQYVLLEIHYDNHNGITNAVDEGSGFSLVYTSTLRTHDIGVLALGHVTFSIPANRPSYEVVGDCPASCTAKFTNDLNVISNGFHMHKLGTSAFSQQIRGGVEQPNIGRISHFDFNHQSTSEDGWGKVIKPGDRLIHRCMFNSVGRNKSTVFGEGTEDEMCLNFITYYPKVAIGSCVQVQSSYSLCYDGSYLDPKLGITALLPYLVGISNEAYTPVPVLNRTCTAGDIETQQTLIQDDETDSMATTVTLAFLLCVLLLTLTL